MSRSYKTLEQMVNRDDMIESREALKIWANNHETHLAVATAIYAISDPKRSVEAIWEDPTPAESDQVIMAVSEYVEHGDFAAEDDGRYPWGQGAVELTRS